MIDRKQIVDYLLENPIQRGTPGCYKAVADKFEVEPEYIRRIYRTLRENGQVEGEEVLVQTQQNRYFKEHVKQGEADIEVITAKRVKTLEDLIEVCEIDLGEWEVTSWETTKWEVGRKDKATTWKIKDGVVITGDVEDSGKIFVEPLFRVKAKLSRRKLATDFNKQKEVILDELKAYSPHSDILSEFTDFTAAISEQVQTRKEYLLELALFDLHASKLAWGEESGENYDLKIAVTRFKKAVVELLGRVGDLNKVERILLPIGNDMFNVDGKDNMTSNGTMQDTDVRYVKTVRVVRDMVIETIDKLSLIAPVDVVIVSGNHDRITCQMLGLMLESFYHNNEQVSINNAPKLRKYYKYGKNGFMFSHGDSEPHSSLGLIFATEEPKLWADVKFRYSQLGHFHKNKKISYLSVDEHPGFMIQVLPSLSENCAWTTAKGYNSLRSAKGFLYHKEQGLIGEFTYTI